MYWRDVNTRNIGQTWVGEIKWEYKLNFTDRTGDQGAREKLSGGTKIRNVQRKTVDT